MLQMYKRKVQSVTRVARNKYIRTAVATAAAILLIDCVNDIGVEEVEASVEELSYWYAGA